MQTKTKIQKRLQEWINDLKLSIHFENTPLAKEIIGAILKLCQDKKLNKNEILELIEGKEKIKGIIKIGYSKDYNLKMFN